MALSAEASDAEAAVSLDMVARGFVGSRQSATSDRHVAARTPKRKG
jgi:hypothetical protein